MKQTWSDSASNRLSFLTLTGAYEVDAPLVIPSQLVLVLSGATLVPTSSFAGAAMLVFRNAAYAAVVSPSGPAGARLSCATGAGASTGGFAAIAVTDSSFITIDGLSIDSCGSATQPAIALLASSPSAPAVSIGVSAAPPLCASLELRHVSEWRQYQYQAILSFIFTRTSKNRNSRRV